MFFDDFKYMLMLKIKKNIFNVFLIKKIFLKSTMYHVMKHP
jgi:hypothetical protein